LIRTGESGFSTYYKRLGPFAKHATTSILAAPVQAHLGGSVIASLIRHQVVIGHLAKRGLMSYDKRDESYFLAADVRD